MRGSKRSACGPRSAAPTRWERPRPQSSTRQRETQEPSRFYSVTRRLRTQFALLAST